MKIGKAKKALRRLERSLESRSRSTRVGDKPDVFGRAMIDFISKLRMSWSYQLKMFAAEAGR